MGVASSPIRLPDDLYDSAAAIAPTRSRSAAQQIAHWARIGREFERVAVRDVEAVLNGTRSYDDLNDREQAVARAEIAERMDARRQWLDLEGAFRVQGITPWVSTDDDGNVVLRGSGQEG